MLAGRSRSAGGAGGADGPGSGGNEGRRPRTFVPVESLVPRPAAAATAVLEATVVAGDAGPEPETLDRELPETGPSAPEVPPGVAGPIPGRWWLWGDPAPWPEP